MHKWVFSTRSVSKHINTEILSSRSNLSVNDPLNRWQNLSTVFAPSGGSRTAETGMKSGLYRFQVIVQTKWKRDFYFRLWCSAFLAIAWLLLARNRFILLTRRRHNITVLLNVDDSLCRYHSLKITGCAVAQALSVNGDTSFLYGSPRLSDFFPSQLWGSDPQPILTQNGSNDVDSRKDVPFLVKIATFHTPWSPMPLKSQNFANFWTFKFFSLNLAFNIRGSEREHSLFFIGAQWKWHSEYAKWGVRNWNMYLNLT